MNAPTTTDSNQGVRSIRSRYFGGDAGPLALLGRRYRRAEPSRSTAPSTTSSADAIFDGVVCLELKSWPCRTKTVSRQSTAIANSQPQMNAIARRRPDDMLSRTIIVTTEPGLVNATARPKPATTGIRFSMSAYVHEEVLH